ncbi:MULTISPECIES: hypothetical protein [unclassified Curtobacterium]|uniref:hypothetical protein n=1 Tax=unclassified Curtobacterium TaxID=257496 RepID=UPI000DAA0E8B|nr:MULTISPECIES: hypothetical protein [unclassified Curtobacterium]PZE25978.1 hypothetical protein DEI86_09035 [Curtobacterium sp. MCBD17_028]PZF61971.1 hypothetical protein DEI92_00075 [Curtobacterium sp. MCBD17_034]PZM34095.1 hypothetical protein DEI90_10625 [Curtobacterium sp. MCBD17_031]
MSDYHDPADDELDGESAPEPIRGKVAQLLTATDLVINRGSDDGVREGMQFAVLDPSGTDIKDPDTGEVIGSLPIAKTVLKIVRVEPRLAVARTFRVKQSGFSLATIAGMTTGDRSETLRSDERRLQQMLDEKDAKVSVGDAVERYIGDFPGMVLDF